MFIFGFIGLLTLEVLALIAAIFLVIYVKKNELSKLYRFGSKFLLVLVHLFMIGTIAIAAMHCCGGCKSHCAKKEMSHCQQGADHCKSKCESK